LLPGVDPDAVHPGNLAGRGISVHNDAKAGNLAVNSSFLLGSIGSTLAKGADLLSGLSSGMHPRWARLKGMNRTHRLQSWDNVHYDPVVDPETQRLTPPPEPSPYATAPSAGAGYNAVWANKKAREAADHARKARAAADATETHSHKAELLALESAAAAGVAADIDRVHHMVNGLNKLLAQAFAHVAPEDYSVEPHEIRYHSKSVFPREASEGYNVGDAVLVWSRRLKKWLPATVERAGSDRMLRVKYGNPYKQAQVGPDEDNRQEAEEREQADLMPELVVARNLGAHVAKVQALLQPAVDKVLHLQRVAHDPELCSTCPREPGLVRELDSIKAELMSTAKRIRAVTRKSQEQVKMLDPLRRETVKQTRESPPTTNGPELLRPDEEPWWPDRPTKDFGEEQVEFDAVLYNKKTGRPYLGRRVIDMGVGRIGPGQGALRPLTRQVISPGFL